MQQRGNPPLTRKRTTTTNRAFPAASAEYGVRRVVCHNLTVFCGVRVHGTRARHTQSSAAAYLWGCGWLRRRRCRQQRQRQLQSAASSSEASERRLLSYRQRSQAATVAPAAVVAAAASCSRHQLDDQPRLLPPLLPRRRPRRRCAHRCHANRWICTLPLRLCTACRTPVIATIARAAAAPAVDSVAGVDGRRARVAVVVAVGPLHTLQPHRHCHWAASHESCRRCTCRRPVAPQPARCRRCR